MLLTGHGVVLYLVTFEEENEAQVEIVIRVATPESGFNTKLWI